MIKGFVESVDRFQIKGWAYDSENPNSILEIVIFRNNVLLGRATANLYRKDLSIGGIGLGNHAFILNIENGAIEFCNSEVQAFAKTSGGKNHELERLSEQVSEAKTIQPSLSFSGITTDLEKTPVFVLGAARSGTSAVAQALLSLPRFEGEDEGHALDLLAHFAVALDKFYIGKTDELTKTTMVAKIPKAYFDDAMDDMFRVIAAKCYAGRTWVEKTPNANMIYLAPRFHRIWPHARFIFMKRRGIENIQSRQSKFPEVSFHLHCREWAEAMGAWSTVRDQLVGCAIEVDQLYLAQDPTAVGQTIGEFLRIDQADIETIIQFLRSERPQRTATNLSSMLSPVAPNWDALMWDAFDKICGESMRSYGYGRGYEYFLPGCERMIAVV